MFTFLLIFWFYENYLSNISSNHINYQNTEAYSETCETSKVELFAKIVNGWKSLDVTQDRFLNVYLG